jgi:S1-C subfamily serine protease
MWLLSPALAASLDEHERRFYAPSEVEEPVRAEAIADFGYGSGFLLADGRTLLTCLHVARRVRETGVVIMGRGTALERTVRVEILATAPELDLALYRAERVLGVGIAMRETPAVVGEPVLVMGYPGGQPVRVSYGHILRNDIRITSVPALEYDAMADWGSSGSVVMDGQGRALAVHWAWDQDGRWDGWMLGVSLMEAAARWPELQRALSP